MSPYPEEVGGATGQVADVSGGVQRQGPLWTATDPKPAPVGGSSPLGIGALSGGVDMM